MKDWRDNLTDDPAIGALINRLEPGRRLLAAGAWGSSVHLVAGAVARRTGRPVLLVLAHLDDADEAVEDIGLFEGVETLAFPALEVMPGETNVAVELLADRLAVVSRLAAGGAPDVLVAPIQALMQAVPRSGALAAAVRSIQPGDDLSPGALIDWLAAGGYDRVEVIEQPGQFAVRGGIVDVFSPGNSPPVRLDFFGDQLDAISQIDLDSMASLRNLETARLMNADTDTIQSDDQTTALWSLLPEQTIVLVAETLEVAEQGRGYYERLTDARGIYAPPTVFKALDRFAAAQVNQFGATREGGELHLPAAKLEPFSEKADEAVRELGAMASGDRTQPPHRVVVLCQKQAELDRLGELILEHAPDAADRITLEVGYLFRGLIWQSGGGDQAPAVALVPHHELFHRYATRRRLRRVPGLTPTGAETFFDLDVGDYVVHADHGVAVFRGLRTMHKQDAAEEYLTLEFADKALLHVPASQIDRVGKYIGGFSGRPPLSKLGGKRWKKQKEQVAEAVKDLAAELLRVQAARASMPGVRYEDDTPWMTRFEEEFPYEETDDQLAAIAEVKRDMTTPQPMDRLICGDVGFGKTEVAMRAAFKAVEGGRQVAVLCPTTVLCEQHERTFGERMADYPVRIESISRFKSDAEARRIIEAAADGRVDVLIGTHRLLSEDVRFKELGLVIVDEEQRFGVEHKNRLMRFRVTVEVLTMSATPIPRTLHMSLLGLRDISSLSTPPADRRAIVTEVVPFERERVRRAILRELNRGGQCFFVHNRVHNIHDLANDLRALVPEARFIVGHGQMKPRELEDVMLRFVRGDADVLVSTTIIESGIDIPAANTMFIADADRFGLAELHQLRGRVGRYKHRAYCYLLLPETRTLSEVALKRLRAIEQFAMLGAGFKIAMRDMEIRGVGNILGPEQSGHIATVGYQMYCQLLAEQTAVLKNQTPPTTSHAHLELGVAGHLPRNYIPSDKHRMEAYRRINRATSRDELADVQKALTDAYGPLPEPAQTMLALAEIKAGLTALGVQTLFRQEQDLIFRTRHVRAVYEQLAEAPGSVRLVDAPTDDAPGTVYYRPPANYLDPPATLLAVLRKLMRPAIAA